MTGTTLGQDLVVFEPGTPARAAEVNANFEVLRRAIDNNAIAIDTLSNSAGVSRQRQINRSVDCTGTDPDADYGSITEALAEAPVGLLTLDISGICQENVAINALDGVSILGFPFDGTIDGIIALNGGQTTVTVIGSQLLTLLDMVIEGQQNAIYIDGSSDVYVGSTSAIAETGHGVKVVGSQLTVGFDNVFTGGNEENAASLLASNATLINVGLGNVFNARANAIDAAAMRLTNNSSFEAVKGNTPEFNGLLHVRGSASFSATSATINGPILIEDASHLSFRGTGPDDLSVQLNNSVIDVRGGASASFRDVNIAPRLVSVDSNAYLLIRDANLKTNTLGASFGGAVTIDNATVDGDVSISGGGQFLQDAGSAVTGVIGCASNAICL